MASLQVGASGGVGFCFGPLDGGRRRARRAVLRPPRASATVAEDQEKVRLGESSVAVSKLGIGAWSWGARRHHPSILSPWRNLLFLGCLCPSFPSSSPNPSRTFRNPQRRPDTMNGLLASPCTRPALFRPIPSSVTRLLPAKTLALPPLRLPRSIRASPPPPRAAAQVAASAVGGLLAPLSALEVGLRSINLAPLRPPIAAAMSAAVRWLGVYREVLLVGVLFSWFPNIPWDRQPFSALRDLCDPFLALCREVMPPVFGRKLDLSPLVAFMAIDILIMILRPQPRM